MKERIAKGLTISRGYYGGYVEENILHKLIIDAIYELEATTDEKVDYHIYPDKEFKRLFNIPYESVMVKVRECEKKIGVIPEPERKIEYIKESESVCDQCSCYQLNYIKVDHVPYSLNWKDEEKKRLYNIFPFLGKVYYCSDGKYMQVYLYDYHNSTKGLETVLCELENLGVVFTKKSE